ncbi:MAG: helix-turn-helix domain-containing protein [Spirochaetes bacterium]|nr:MAG: helix-turn-helix domain-containing protein [Spirochaetota bacterium]
MSGERNGKIRTPRNTGRVWLRRMPMLRASPMAMSWQQKMSPRKAGRRFPALADHNQILLQEKRALGILLREARTAKGWSQEKLAEECQTTQCYISHLEKVFESQSLPSFDVYFRVLWTLGYECEIIVKKQ